MFRNLKTLSISFALGFSSLLYAETPCTNLEIREITPPNLDKAHLGKKILCHRPMRRGAPAMFLEVQKEKLIAHNYGFGGSGWTLGPGAAQHVINLVEEKVQGKFETPIAVIGAGVIGLYSALELVERGYKDVTVISKAFENLTSHNAGGLLAPVSMDNGIETQNLIDKIGVDAYIYYKEIAEGKNKDITEGALIVPTYFASREESGLEPYVGVVMKPAKDVILDFKNGTQRKMVVYDDGIFIDTSRIMELLTKALQNKVKFEKREIHNFDEVSQNVVINCTGLGASKLTLDDAMVSVQGHLIMLKDQNPKDLQHMILTYFGEDTTTDGFKVKRSFYIFPKKLPGSGDADIGVIGGTFIEGATEASPNELEFDLMIEGARKFYGIR